MCWQTSSSYFVSHNEKSFKTNKQVNKPKPISECFVSWKHLSDFPNISHWELGNSGGQNTLESPIALSRQGRILEIIALTTAKRFLQSFKLAQNSFDGQLQPVSSNNQDSPGHILYFWKVSPAGTLGMIEESSYCGSGSSLSICSRSELRVILHFARIWLGV